MDVYIFTHWKTRQTWSTAEGGLSSIWFVWVVLLTVCIPIDRPWPSIDKLESRKRGASQSDEHFFCPLSDVHSLQHLQPWLTNQNTHTDGKRRRYQRSQTQDSTALSLLLALTVRHYNWFLCGQTGVGPACPLLLQFGCGYIERKRSTNQIMNHTTTQWL